MTKEEAITKLIRIRQVQGPKSEAHEALGMAIDALSQPSLPEGLEEAATASMPKPNGIESNTDFSFFQMIWMFEQGAEWMAGKRVSLSHLIAWYVHHVDAHEPVWTEEHLEELVKDYILIPKD